MTSVTAMPLETLSTRVTVLAAFMWTRYGSLVVFVDSFAVLGQV
jgi:hypothetical protein